MADFQGTPGGARDNTGGPAGGLSAFIKNFQALPKNAKIAILAGVGFGLLLFMVRGGDAPPPQQQAPAQQQDGQMAALNQDPMQAPTEAESDFNPASANRESLRRGFVTQQTMALSQLREKLTVEFDEKKNELETMKTEIQQMTDQLNQSMVTAAEEARQKQEALNRQQEEISRLLEESRRLGIRPGTATGANTQDEVIRRPRERISQTPLGSVGGGQVGADRALLQGVLQSTAGVTTVPTQDANGQGFQQPQRLPFIPPLGFVKGTLLNGVDAIADGGSATPALIRLKGIYKTAMNSTVQLDGCFLLVEFEGVISTERARGKASRMTCVYPDRGAVTYEIAGYVVDAEDGIEGVPGIFFEGDSGRIAMAIAAQFAAGVANVIVENQQDTTTNTDGSSTSTLTGSQTRASVAGGSANALNSLTNYLTERAARISPFVRIDATREIHVVMLSGTELRTEGDAWTLLFNANNG